MPVMPLKMTKIIKTRLRAFQNEGSLLRRGSASDLIA
jgi:hypothetical protein